MVIELKKPGVPARAAFDENLTHYKQQIPALFWFNALLIASDRWCGGFGLRRWRAALEKQREQ